MGLMHVASDGYPSQLQAGPPTIGNQKIFKRRETTPHSRICSHMHSCQDMQMKFVQSLSKLTYACPMCRHLVAQVTTISAQCRRPESASSHTCYDSSRNNNSRSQTRYLINFKRVPLTKQIQNRAEVMSLDWMHPDLDSAFVSYFITHRTSLQHTQNTDPCCKILKLDEYGFETRCLTSETCSATARLFK